MSTRPIGYGSLVPLLARPADKIFFLVSMYRPVYWFWDVVEACRRLALTSVLSIFTAGSTLQLFLGLWLCIFFIMAYIQFKPFVR